MTDALPKTSPPAFVSTAQAAEFLEVHPQTMRRWRQKHEGPPYYTVGRSRAVYRVTDLKKWAAKRMVRVVPQKSAEGQQ